MQCWNRQKGFQGTGTTRKVGLLRENIPGSHHLKELIAERSVSSKQLWELRMSLRLMRAAVAAVSNESGCALTKLFDSCISRWSKRGRTKDGCLCLLGRLKTGVCSGTLNRFFYNNFLSFAVSHVCMFKYRRQTISGKSVTVPSVISKLRAFFQLWIKVQGVNNRMRRATGWNRNAPMDLRKWFLTKVNEIEHIRKNIFLRSYLEIMVTFRWCDRDIWWCEDTKPRPVRFPLAYLRKLFQVQSRG